MPMHSWFGSLRRSVWLSQLRPFMASLQVGVASLVVMSAFSPAWADLRTTFPGRRIGGGTRGDCSARFLAHVVLPSSVFAPDGRRTIAVLVGQGSAEAMLVSTLRAYDDGSAASPPAVEQKLKVQGPGLFILSGQPIRDPMQWESHLDCGFAPERSKPLGTADFQLDFVGQHSPPAVSLLLPSPSQVDMKLQATLDEFTRSCGALIPLADIVQAISLDLTDLSSQLPSQIKVYCSQ